MPFWMKKKQIIRLKSLPKANARDHSESDRRVHLSASRPGSLTLEAAVIFPFTAAFWVSLLLVIRALQIETAVQEALTYAGRWTAVEASAVDSPQALEASAIALAKKEMMKYPVIDQFAAGGAVFGVLVTADADGDILNLQAEYFVKVPVGFWGLQGIPIVQSEHQRKWTGKDPASQSGKDGFNQTVYYTDYGTVYHKSLDCKYLNPQIHTTSSSVIDTLRNQDRKRYDPCPSCGGKGDIVFYTPYGESYHSSLECGGLKRTIHTGTAEELGGMHACSSCGG